METDENLIELARAYVHILEKIENTKDPKKLKYLEELRINLHWEFIRALTAHGIMFTNRDHATRIAIQMAKDQR